MPHFELKEMWNILFLAPVLVPGKFQVWDGGYNNSNSLFLVPCFWSGAMSKSPIAQFLLFSDSRGLENFAENVTLGQLTALLAENTGLVT